MPQLRKADVIVVLGCQPSARLKRQVERGVQLFQQGLAPVLVLSGGGRGSEPEAEIMRRMALAWGVPEAALLVEPNSRDTVDNARGTAALLRARGWRTTMLVSDSIHLPRATLLFRLAGVEIVGRSGLRSSSRMKAIWAVIWETAALPRSLLLAFLTARESRRR